jgi:hypothetical protein
LKAGAHGCLADAPDRLVPEDKALFTRGWLAVATADNLAIGATESDGDNVNQHLALRPHGSSDLGELGTIRYPRSHRQCLHERTAARSIQEPDTLLSSTAHGGTLRLMNFSGVSTNEMASTDPHHAKGTPTSSRAVVASLDNVISELPSGVRPH